MARTTEQSTQLDRQIGARIREQRENIGMTQGELAKAIGVSYQQIHKYECGTNRISAGRLWLIAEAINLPVQAFFDPPAATAARPYPEKVHDGRLCLEVARNFRQIGNPRYQEALHLLVRILAD